MIGDCNAGNLDRNIDLFLYKYGQKEIALRKQGLGNKNSVFLESFKDLYNQGIFGKSSKPFSSSSDLPRQVAVRFKPFGKVVLTR